MQLLLCKLFSWARFDLPHRNLIFLCSISISIYQLILSTLLMCMEAWLSSQTVNLLFWVLSILLLLIFLVRAFLLLTIYKLCRLFCPMLHIVNSLFSWIISYSQCSTQLWNTFACASPTEANLIAGIMLSKRRMGSLVANMMLCSTGKCDKHETHLDLLKRNRMIFEYVRSTKSRKPYLFFFITNQILE